MHCRLVDTCVLQRGEFGSRYRAHRTGPAGAITTRYDAADIAASRFYGYDALLRLTCEARGSGSTNPTASDCMTTSAQLASLVTYNDGVDAAHPVDTRATSFTRTESGSYVSPATEVASYLGGSSQLQSISRGASTMVIAHDGLGRRSHEYDSIDPVRSRRDYTYTPNGQLDTIIGRTPTNLLYSVGFRYDDRGRPITIATTLDGYSRDSYGLYWDDADRLIAVSIMMPVCRGTTTPGDQFCPSGGYRTASWHYHYLGSQLVAATHQLGSQTYRYWAAADERGLIYRMLDQNGGTAWQTRWDANGSRTADSFLGSGSIDEMWVPFGLPGQVVLQAMPIAQQVGGGGPTSNPGTEAFASGSGSTWTRPPIALNQVRAYDPLSGQFLLPDPSDLAGRFAPEGMQAFRNSPVVFADPSGSDSIPFTPREFFPSSFTMTFDVSCGDVESKYRQAIIDAARDLKECDKEECADPVFKRQLLYALSVGTYYCVAPGRPLSLETREMGVRTITNYQVGPNANVRSWRDFGARGNFVEQRPFNAQNVNLPGELAPQRRIIVGPHRQCPERLLAHEAFHTSYNTLLPGQSYDLAASSFFNVDGAQMRGHKMSYRETEDRIDRTIEACVQCR